MIFEICSFIYFKQMIGFSFLKYSHKDKFKVHSKSLFSIVYDYNDSTLYFSLFFILFKWSMRDE